MFNLPKELCDIIKDYTFITQANAANDYLSYIVYKAYTIARPFEVHPDVNAIRTNIDEIIRLTAIGKTTALLTSIAKDTSSIIIETAANINDGSSTAVQIAKANMVLAQYMFYHFLSFKTLDINIK